MVANRLGLQIGGSVSGDKIVVPDVREYMQYLGFRPGDKDCKSAGNRGYLIPCPFHNDTNPSMAVYDDGAWCFSGCGGKYYNLAYLASEVKGITYGEALKDLGAERLEASDKMVDYRPTEILHFCEPNPDKYVEAFQTAHAKCSTEYPPEMVEWLERKKLTEVAKKFDWRWHDGTVYKKWGKGIVIPYQDPSQGGAIVYERFRAWNEKEHKFEKVISPVGTNSVPYLATFRGNSRQWICEGESDCCSLYALGESAVGIPGSTAKKVINTIIAMFNDINVVEEVIVCGDEDAAGQGMNLYVEEAVKKIAPRLRVSRYEHVLHDNKADMSDEYVKGVLRLPDALKTQEQGSPKLAEVKDTFDFGKYTDELSAWLDRCALYGVDPWVENDAKIGVLNDDAITDSLCDIIEHHFVVVENTRGGDVLIPKLEVSGVEHFVLQINNGEHAGVYDVLPDAIACGWTEEQKDDGGAVKMMMGIQCKDLVSFEDLDFKG